jgi:hypothetical protein
VLRFIIRSQFAGRALADNHTGAGICFAALLVAGGLATPSDRRWRCSPHAACPIGAM